MPRDQIVIDQSGPLPITKEFDAQSNLPCSIVVSATARNLDPTPNMIGVVVYLDQKVIGEILFWGSNEMHLTLPTKFFPAQLEIGKHTIMLAPLGARTGTDSNDFFQVVVDY